MGTYGGYNRTHGTVEDALRIDSFYLPDVVESGAFFCGGNRYIDAQYDPEYMPDMVWIGRLNRRAIRVDYKPNGFGGSQPFFLCSGCGSRVRYLYRPDRFFLCRKCARLNYRSQQKTKEPAWIRNIYR